MTPISILILTHNEEQNLPACLASVAWSDDVHVLDSQSTDSTVEIARAAGAHVTTRAFDNWAAHQNWAMQNVPFRHPWVFYLDADERVTPQLAQALQSAVQTAGDLVAFRVQRRDFLNGVWLRHVQASPFYLRLFRPDKMRYERLVNPVSLPDGPTGQVAGYLDHYPFSKGISQWLERHNQYSTFEARQIMENRTRNIAFSPIGAFTAKDFHTRRFHQKELFYRIPARPLVKFFALYIGKRGFLDGHAGLTYSILQSIYEYMIVLKTRELEAPGSSLAS
ncbi:MAG: glycosyltransferase family 2 protein [Acidobacteriaceae bacterium]|nr:glycosyltransferase family 2 protein [Acidobacteriaceae bacterium]